MNEEGRIVEEEPYKNPRYLSGTTREVYQLFNDFCRAVSGFSLLLRRWDIHGN